MLGLNLFSQLCQLSRMRRPSTVSSAGVESSSNEENPNSNNDTNVKMDQLWKIALCAHNTDVSMKAIQVFHFYCNYISVFLQLVYINFLFHFCPDLEFGLFWSRRRIPYNMHAESQESQR